MSFQLQPYERAALVAETERLVRHCAAASAMGAEALAREGREHELAKLSVRSLKAPETWESTLAKALDLTARATDTAGLVAALRDTLACPDRRAYARPSLQLAQAVEQRAQGALNRGALYLTADLATRLRRAAVWPIGPQKGLSAECIDEYRALRAVGWEELATYDSALRRLGLWPIE